MKFLLQTLFEKPAMNFLSRIGSVAVLMLIASAPSAVGQIYTFTFTGNDGMDATGTIDISDGVAQSGSIYVTGIPIENETDPITLITAAGDLLPGSGSAQNHNGDNLPYDNIVNFANNPFLTGNGMDFGSGQYAPTKYNTLIGLWGGDVYGDPVQNEYTLFVGEAELDGNGNVIPGETEYVYTDTSGTLALNLVPVPEPSTSALILCALTMAFVAVRRRCAAE